MASFLVSGSFADNSQDIILTNGTNWEIFGWKVNSTIEEEIRSQTKAPLYNSSCSTGFFPKNNECIWDPPKVVEPIKNFCAIGYDYLDTDKKCHLLGDFDPFFNFFSEKKWWQVDFEKDFDYRKKRGFTQYSPKCKLGYGMMDGNCTWFVPIVLKPIDKACPSTYVLLDGICQWTGNRSIDAFPYKVSLAAAQSLAIERNLLDGLLTGRKINDSSVDSQATSIKTAESYTVSTDVRFKCNSDSYKLVQGTSVTIKITNDIVNNKPFDLCTFDDQGAVDYAGYTFNSQNRQTQVTTHTGKSYQIRLWSSLGKCQGGIVSVPMSFQESGEVTLRNILNSCLPTS